MSNQRNRACPHCQQFFTDEGRFNGYCSPVCWSRAERGYGAYTPAPPPQSALLTRITPNPNPRDKR